MNKTLFPTTTFEHILIAEMIRHRDSDAFQQNKDKLFFVTHPISPPEKYTKE